MNFVAAEELFSTNMEEMQRGMVQAHYEELSLHKAAGYPLSPSYGRYLQKERDGELLFVALRANGALVGYYIGFLGLGLHYNTCLTLTMDIYYIMPQARLQGAGALRLFRCVERCAQARGVGLVMHGSKDHKSTERLFKALGYAPVETWHGKFLQRKGL